MDTAAFIAHIVSQTKQNVQFLITHNQISANEGRDILAKLPSIPSTTLDPVQNLTQQAQGLMITPPPSSAATSNAPSLPTTPNFYPSPSSPSYIAPAKPIVQARAIWSYNEHGQDPNDLAFSAGDIIEIVAETNADWWTGKHRGREALFPSNYVNKLPTSTSPTLASATSHHHDVVKGQTPGYTPPPYTPSYAPSYQPTGGYQGPPPPQSGGGYQPYGGPPPGAPAPVNASQEPPKGPLGGGLGNTLAHSAVGGAGFGAGSAVGSGIINAIF